MARTVALSVLLSEIRYRADIQSMTARHPDDDLKRAINQSIQRLREKVSQLSRMYLKPVNSTMPVGVLAPYAFGTVPWPSGAVRVYGIDVTVQYGDIRPLEYIQWEQRNDYHDVFGQNVGIPCAFSLFDIGQESTNTVSTGSIAIFPAPGSAYAYTIWYLPVFTDLANNTDVYNGVDGWEEWVVWDVVKKVAARDNDMQNCAALATQEQDRVWLDIARAAGTIQRVGPVRRNDVASRSRSNRNASMWRRP